MQYDRVFSRAFEMNISGLVLDNFPLVRYLGNSAYRNCLEARKMTEKLYQESLKPHIVSIPED